VKIALTLALSQRERGFAGWREDWERLLALAAKLTLALSRKSPHPSPLPEGEGICGVEGRLGAAAGSGR